MCVCVCACVCVCVCVCLLIWCRHVCLRSMRAASKAYGADSCAAVAAEPVASLPDAAYRKSRSFCEPHAQLRHMLDAAAASTSLSSSGRASKGKGKSKAKPVSESSRYLPRDYGKAKAKAVSKTGAWLCGWHCDLVERTTTVLFDVHRCHGCVAGAMPLSSIPSSSWLLHELMTGKLGATLKAGGTPLSLPCACSHLCTVAVVLQTCGRQRICWRCPQERQVSQAQR